MDINAYPYLMPEGHIGNFTLWQLEVSDADFERLEAIDAENKYVLVLKLGDKTRTFTFEQFKELFNFCELG